MITDLRVLICDSQFFPKIFFFTQNRVPTSKAQILLITSTAKSDTLLLYIRNQLRCVAADSLHLSWGLTKLAVILGNLARGLCVWVHLLHNNPQTRREGLIVMIWFRGLARRLLLKWRSQASPKTRRHVNLPFSRGAWSSLPCSVFSFFYSTSHSLTHSSLSYSA